MNHVGHFMHVRFPRSSSPFRHGFTLIEMLIVIGIILLLAALTVPLISMIKSQARDALCRNNLQQLGIGITGYQQQYNNRFPETLGILFAVSGPLESESPKVLLCPHDARKGSDPDMGRPGSWGAISELYQPKCSYVFEAADVDMGTTAKNYFMLDKTKMWGDDGRRTWADAKVFALKHDNTGNKPFRLSDFPIIRCFWHTTWAPVEGDNKQKKVLNLAWDMSVFWSIPKWEDQVRGP